MSEQAAILILIAGCAACAIGDARRTTQGGVVRHRLLTFGSVAALLAASHLLWTDPAQRAKGQYLFIVTLGYGHLIGALIFSRSRIMDLSPRGAPPLLFVAFLVCSAASGFLIYAELLNAFPFTYAIMVALGVWHTTENELCLNTAYREDLRVAAIPRSADHHLISIGVALLLLLAAARTPEWRAAGGAVMSTELSAFGLGCLAMTSAALGALLLMRNLRGPKALVGSAIVVAATCLYVTSPQWLSLSDLFVLSTLTHLNSWLFFFTDKIRLVSRSGSSEQARAMGRRLALVHVPAAAVCGALLAIDVPWARELQWYVFSPAIYVYWSAIHVGQTLVVRGLEAAPAAPELGSPGIGSRG